MKHNCRKRATDDWPLTANTTGQCGLTAKQVCLKPPSGGGAPLTGPRARVCAPGQ